MRKGHLTLETHPLHPGVIRLFVSEKAPEPPKGHDGGSIRYIARFSDVATARMNVHEQLRRRMVDVNHNTYQAEPVEGIAAIDAVELNHASVWTDPSLDNHQIQTLVQNIHQQHLRRDRMWQMVGMGAVGLFLVVILLVL